MYNETLNNCSFDNCSVDSYIKYHISDSLLLFKEMKTYYCPKCNKIHPFEGTVGELQCCGIKSVYLNGSTKSNDTLIFTKIENSKIPKIESEETSKANLLSTNLPGFYYINSRSNLKYKENGYTLFIDNEDTNITVENADLNTIIYLKDDKFCIFDKKNNNNLTLDMLDKFDEDVLLSFTQDDREKVLRFCSINNIDTKIDLMLMNLILDKRLILSRYINTINNNKKIDVLNEIKDKNEFSMCAYFNGFSDVDDNIDEYEFINIMTLGRIIPDDKSYAESFAKYIINYYDGNKNTYLKLFKKMKENNVYHRYGDNCLSSNSYSFMEKLRKFPLVSTIFSTFACNLDALGSLKCFYKEVTEKEFKTIIKQKDSKNFEAYDHYLERSVLMDKNSLKLYVIGGYDFALKYIEKYDVYSYNQLGHIENILEVIDSDDEKQKVLEEMISDISKLYALSQIVERMSSWDIRKLVENDEYRKAFINLSKQIYVGKFSRQTLTDFFNLKEKAEEIYPNLRGREINYNRIVLEHDYYLQLIRNNKRDLTSVFKDRYETFKPFRITANQTKFIIEAPKDINDLIKEGTELSHCVDTYGNALENGQEMVLFMREKRGVPLYTISLDENGNICQSSGKSHSAVPAEILVDLQRVIANDEKLLKSVKAFFNKK